MKKTRFVLFAVFSLLANVLLSQQSTLSVTVANGTATNDASPMYGYYADEYTRTQTIYPAYLLTSMQNSVINSITFYCSSHESVDFGSARWNVKIGSSTAPSFSSATYNTSELTNVFSGSLTVSGYLMTVELDQPYYYQGGNLLIEFTNSTTGTWVHNEWVGIATNGVLYTINGFNSYSINSISNQYTSDFLPKATFNISVTPDNFSTVYYVTTTGAGNLSGLSWENAMNSPQKAIAQARTARQVLDTAISVWIAQGTYYADPNYGGFVATNSNDSYAFKMMEGVNVYGGFAGNEPANYDLGLRDFTMHQTILDAQQLRGVVVCDIGTGLFQQQTLWDGLTFQNGSAYDAAGALLDTNVVLRNVVIRNCNAQNLAGGISSPRGMTLINCTISNNGANESGGGKLLYSSLTNCTISNNIAGVSAGGLSLNYCYVDSCLVTNNTSNNYAGGLNNDYGVVRNSTFTGNSAYWGGGVNGWFSTYYNCTFLDNEATQGGGGLRCGDSDSIINCRFEDNTAYRGGGVFGNRFYVDSCLFVNDSSYRGGGLYDFGDSNASVNNCVFRDNKASNAGGGMYAYYTIVSNSTFEDNVSTYGGGVVGFYSRFRGCAFVGDSATTSGGGLYADSCMVTSCSFDSCHASYGGGMYIYDTHVFNGMFKDNVSAYGGGVRGECSRFRECVFVGDSATTSGGGLYADSCMVISCSFDSCHAYYGGGTIAFHNSHYDSCTFSNNYGYLGGGGYGGYYDHSLFNDNEAQEGGALYHALTLKNSKAINNTAYWGGGFFYCDTISYCELAFNGGVYGGASISNSSVFSNCLIHHNKADYGDVVLGFISDNPESQGHSKYYNCTIVENGDEQSVRTFNVAGGEMLYNCIVWGNKGDDGYDSLVFYNSAVDGLTSLSNGNIGLSSYNINFDTSLYYPAFIAPYNYNYRLSSSSPCVDAGSNLWNTSDKDIAGTTRILGGAVDMGCYEHVADTSCEGDLVATVDNITTTTASLLWMSLSPSNSSVSVYITDITSNTTTTVVENTVSSPVAINGLQQETNYLITVVSSCDTTRLLTVPFMTLESFFDDTVFRSRFYVTQSGSGSMDGTSWANAMNSIQRASRAAYHARTLADTNVSVWVAEGTYVVDPFYGGYHHDYNNENYAFLVAEGVDVYGGFVGNEPDNYDLTLRDFSGHATILDGQNIRGVLLYDYSNGLFVHPAVWDGMTLQNGYASNAAGASLDTNVILRNITIENCTATHYSGGIYSPHGITVEHSIIRNNSSFYYGGGELYASIINNCSIINNSATYAVGGLSLNFCNVDSCTVTGNQSVEWGGGLNTDYSSVSNSYFSGNVAGDGAGANGWFGSFSNCIFTDNHSTSDGGAVCGPNNSFYECSFVFNSADYSGGAVYGNYNSLDECRFVRDSSRTGGALCGGNMVVRGCHFDSCNATYQGGAISCGGEISNCSFNSCTSGDAGGAISIDQATQPFSRVTGCYSNECSSYYGGGIIVLVKAVVDSSVFANCYAELGGGGAFGNYYHCYFDSDSSGSSGGGLYNPDTVKYSTFRNNKAHSAAAVVIDSPVALVDHCDIGFNHGFPGGAFYAAEGTVANSIIHNNTGYMVAPVSAGYITYYDENGNYAETIHRGRFFNCTFVGNGSYESDMVIGCMSDDTLANCIFWNNGGNAYPENAVFLNCALEGSTNTSHGNIVLAHENVGHDNDANYVAFVWPEYGDYRLSMLSSCINAGNAAYNTSSTDFFGNNRVFGGGIDVGYHENNGEYFCSFDFPVYVDSIMPQTVRVNWYNLGSPSIIQYAAAPVNDSTDWNTVSTLMGSQSTYLSGLLPSTHYVLRIQNNCQDSSSLWSYADFTTLDCRYDSVVETIMACDSFEWNSVVYYSSTSEPTHVLTNSLGCDSTVTLNLTINHSSTFDTSVTACDSYEWQGEELTLGGVSQYQTTNVFGCDSTVTLNLTINHSSTFDTSITACDSYEWQGEELTLGGVSQYQTTNVFGCDSTVTLNLTINHSAESFDTVTVSSTELPFTYNGTDLNAGGDYDFILVTTEGCDSVVYLHFTVSQVGIEAIGYCELAVYPNPTTGKVTIVADGIVRVDAFDIVGRQVASFAATDIVDLSNLDAGQYTLRIVLANGVVVRKVVKM